MKKLIITLIVSWIGLNVSAQSFDTYIKHIDDERPIYNTVELPNHQYVVATVLNDSNNLFTTIFYKLSANGIKLDSLRMPFYVGNTFYKDKKVYFFGNGNSIYTKDTIILGIINPNLMDTIMTKRHYTGMSGFSSLDIKYFKLCNCFTAVGGGAINNYPFAFVFQFDSLLNIVQKKHYKSLDSLERITFYDIMENPKKDGYWVVSSLTLDSLNIIMTGGGATVIPLDSNLVRDSVNFHSLESNVKWKYTTNPNAYIRIDNEASGGVKLTDSTYLFAGRILNQKKGGYLFTDMAYIILDTALQYKKHLFYGTGGAQIDTLDLPAYNVLDRNSKYVYIFHNTGIMRMYANYFSLTKVDMAGNRLWTKHYTSGTHIYGYTVLATADGGALMTGESWDATKGTGNENDIFILKVDSNGNGPGLITSLSKLKIVPESNYLIYPNPVKDELHLLKVNTFGNYTFTLYDAFGREVKSTAWTEDEQIVSTSGLAAGVYIYRIKDKEGRMASGKIVKQ